MLKVIVKTVITLQGQMTKKLLALTICNIVLNLKSSHSVVTVKSVQINRGRMKKELSASMTLLLVLKQSFFQKLDNANPANHTLGPPQTISNA